MEKLNKTKTDFDCVQIVSKEFFQETTDFSGFLFLFIIQQFWKLQVKKHKSILHTTEQKDVFAFLIQAWPQLIKFSAIQHRRWLTKNCYKLF